MLGVAGGMVDIKVGGSFIALARGGGVKEPFV